jgi:hypothetical protein
MELLGLILRLVLTKRRHTLNELAMPKRPLLIRMLTEAEQ